MNSLAEGASAAPVLEDLSPAALSRAIVDNFSDFLETFSSYPGGQLHKDDKISYYITGVAASSFNGVTRANLAEAEADAQIESLLAFAKPRKLPLLWLVRPSDSPADLSRRLQAHGFALVEEPPCMAVDLHAMREDVRGPAGLTIEEVLDDRGISDLMATYKQTRYMRAAFVATYTAAGVGPGRSLRHFVGRLDGTPVAATSLFLGAGVAGIHGVVTVPEARRQGIGTMLTLHALRVGREMGYRVGTLASSEMGYGVYRGLGFEEYCKVGVHVWKSQ